MGDIALVQFPFADRAEAKLRPALLISRVPGNYADWLICMITLRTYRQMAGFDELIGMDDPDFTASGLKASSVIRIARLVTVEERLLLARLGSIGPERLQRVRKRLGEWVQEENSAAAERAATLVLERNLALTGEVMLSLLARPELLEQLPENFRLVVLPEQEPDIWLYNLELLRTAEQPAQPLVFARIRQGTGHAQPETSFYAPLAL